MARNKESLLLLLDVGPTMHAVLPEVEKVCSMLVQKKMIHNKFDEVGVILFGTEETSNDLTSEVGGYEHVTVLRHIKVVDGDIADALQQLPRGTFNGDFFDAIVVGMDMLIKKYGPTNKAKKRLCLITNALCPTRDPFEGTKEVQVSTIAEQMSEHGMKLESIVVRGMLNYDMDKKIMDENDHLLDLAAKKTLAKFQYVDSPTSLLGALRTRNISPVTIFRGDLELSSRLKIKVWVYKKVSEEKFPTLKKYSDIAPPTDRFATHEIKVDYEYKTADDSGQVVTPEQRIKGYRYGPHVIPISTAELEAVKFSPEKSVKLLGFTDASNVLRHYYMKDVNIFIAEPGNESAVLAVSALARAMKEINKVAILRCVWRKGQSNVVVGVLSPNISDKDNIPDSLYFNVLPFAEDVREFQFPSFRNLPLAWQPTEEQQEAADNLVKMLDLAPPGKEEVLKPDLTPNPVLERFYRFLDQKSKQPDAVVPPPDNTLKRITEPDPELLSLNKSVIDIFRKSFELKENPKLKKGSKRPQRERPSGSDGEKDALDDGHDMKMLDAEKEAPSENHDVKVLEVKREASSDTHDMEVLDGKKDASSDTHDVKMRDCVRETSDVADDAKKPKSIETIHMAKVDKIGNSTPVRDFEAMLSRRDDPDWVNKAIKGMRNKVINLLEDSYEGDNYNETLECLVALRKGCILEQEPKQFNDFLQYVCRYCRQHGLDDFCELLSTKGMSLITKSQAADSDVADDDARTYLVSKEPKVE